MTDKYRNPLLNRILFKLIASATLLSIGGFVIGGVPGVFVSLGLGVASFIVLLAVKRNRRGKSVLALASSGVFDDMPTSKDIGEVWKSHHWLAGAGFVDGVLQSMWVDCNVDGVFIFFLSRPRDPIRRLRVERIAAAQLIKNERLLRVSLVNSRVSFEIPWEARFESTLGNRVLGIRGSE